MFSLFRFKVFFMFFTHDFHRMKTLALDMFLEKAYGSFSVITFMMK